MSKLKKEKTIASARQIRIIKENLWGYGFLAPYLIVFATFFVVPFFYSIYISFFDWNMFDPSQTTFVGLDNFRNILFADTIFNVRFWHGLTNTLMFVVVSVPLLIIIPLGLALLLDLEPPGYKIFRMLLFMPTVLSISAVILIWRWQLNPGGFINSLLTSIGLNEISFLNSQPWAWLSIILVTIWWTIGTNLVILGAGLKNVDRSLYEAASIDGATTMQIFFRITLPSIKPQIFMVTFMTVISSFNIYGQPELLTNGGPEKSTEVLMMYIRQFTFGSNAKPGIASAMALMLGIIMIAVSLIQTKVLGGRNDQ